MFTKRQEINFEVDAEDIRTPELLLKGLSRALVMYLRMYHPLDLASFKTYAMVGKLIDNFAIGVLGIRIPFNTDS